MPASISPNELQGRHAPLRTQTGAIDRATRDKTPMSYSIAPAWLRRAFNSLQVVSVTAALKSDSSLPRVKREDSGRRASVRDSRLTGTACAAKRVEC